MKPSPLESVGAVVAGIATPVVVIAVAVLLFLNPLWVSFEQDRTGVDALTGFSQSEVHRVTGSILSDLVFGPPSFDVEVNGAAVLDARERGHMVDVRRVFFELGAVALVALVALIAAGAALRGGRAFWRAVEIGATGLACGVVVAGLFFALFFDQAFLLFHELFFPPGSFEFDPRTERLVQLFPDQFWSETSVLLALVVLALAVLVAWFARGRTRRGRAAPVGVAAAA